MHNISFKRKDDFPRCTALSLLDVLT